VPPFAEPINSATRYCAVFGHPVRHSASPAMQNAGLNALGLNWRYLAFDVHPDHLAQALEGAKRMGFIGINLTVPHKLPAMELVDELDESARIWGAVNTVRFEGPTGEGGCRPLREFDEPPQRIRSHGFNTDADAITQAIQEDLGLKLAGAKVLLLGTGGAGRTAALKLAAEGISELFLVNRTEEKAREVAEQIGRLYPKVHLRLGYPSGEVDLLLNATSLGLKAADPLPIDEPKFDISRAGFVYDMIYRPAQTPLLKLAKSRGCKTANGLGMLLYQGAKALEIWTGQPAPVQIMREALEKNVYG
jgi:shikimate dehydrogenase